MSQTPDDLLLPGDRIPEWTDEYEPCECNYPPMGAILGTAVDSALLLLEARRWWLNEYVIDNPMRDAEVEAIDAAIAALEQALTAQRRRRETWPA